MKQFLISCNIFFFIKKKKMVDYIQDILNTSSEKMNIEYSNFFIDKIIKNDINFKKNLINDNQNKICNKQTLLCFNAIMFAIKHNGLNIQGIDLENILMNHDVMISAIDYWIIHVNPDVTILLSILSKELKEDKDFMMKVIRRCPQLLSSHLLYKLKKDKDIVMEAMQTNGLYLKYVVEELKKDKQIVVAAVKSNELALKYCHDELMGDKLFMLKVLETNSRAIYFIQKNLLIDTKFMNSAMLRIHWKSVSLLFCHKNDPNCFLSKIPREILFYCLDLILTMYTNDYV